MLRILLIILTGVTAIFLESCFDDTYIDLGNGYKFVWPARHSQYITKNDRVYVERTIVDYVLVEQYVVGLRLKTLPVICRGRDNSYLKNFVMVSNERRYFILNKETGSAYNFSSVEDFQSVLDKLGIRSEISLDYSKFEVVWDYYNKMYNDPNNVDFFNACTQISEQAPRSDL